VAPPNPTSGCISAAAGRLPTAGTIGLSSFRPGGVNMRFCDGSVKFLKNSINLITLWALGSRPQGEVISADSYRPGKPGLDRLRQIVVAGFFGRVARLELSGSGCMGSAGRTRISTTQPTARAIRRSIASE